MSRYLRALSGGGPSARALVENLPLGQAACQHRLANLSRPVHTSPLPTKRFFCNHNTIKMSGEIVHETIKGKPTRAHGEKHNNSIRCCDYPAIHIAMMPLQEVPVSTLWAIGIPPLAMLLAALESINTERR